MVYMPKREIVRGVATAFENGRLKIAKGLPFQVRFTAGAGYLRRVQASTTTW